jgi:hypothetical protein
MRYSLRRALSLDSVDGDTHNPTIAHRFLERSDAFKPFAARCGRTVRRPDKVDIAQDRHILPYPGKDGVLGPSSLPHLLQRLSGPETDLV